MPYQLAQLNIATMKYSLDDPEMKGFVDNLDYINSLADNSPGFVWRLQDEEGDATSQRPLGESTLVNLSVWKDVESLNQYVYKTAHVEIMKRRKEWFDRMKEAHYVLWWVPKNHHPDIHEAVAKLKLFQSSGPTPDAFNFRQAFASPDAAPLMNPFTLGDECPAT